MMKRIIIILFAFAFIVTKAEANSNDSAYHSLLQKIKAADGAVTANDFAAWISEAALCENCTDELRDILTAKIHNADALYSNRAFYEATRLKGFIIYNLSLTGLNGEAASIITGEIAAGHDAYLVAASLRALSTYAYKDSAVIPFLLKFITQDVLRDEWVDIEKYQSAYPLAVKTSVKEEALNAIEANAIETPEIKNALEALASSDADNAFSETIKLKAQKTLASFATAKPSCCSKKQEQKPLLFSANESYFATKWLAQKDRIHTLPSNIRMSDAQGHSFSFKKMKGKPILLAFFYTRCINPEKCSKTVTELGKLQTLLKQQNIAGDVYIGLATFDPDYDTPEMINNYAALKGLQPDENMKAMNIPEVQLHDLMKDLQVEANYDGSIISIHDVQLFLFDKDNRFVRMYGHILWNSNDVINDVQKLVNE